MAVGVDGLFLETHPDPDSSPSDGPNMVPLDALRNAEPLAEMQILRRGNRLSVTPVTPAEWKAVLSLEAPKARKQR